MKKVVTLWICTMMVMMAFVVVAVGGTGSNVSDILPLKGTPSEVKGIHIDEMNIYTNSLTDFIEIPFWSTDNLDSVKVTILNSERTEYLNQIVWQDDDDWTNYTSFEEQLASGNTTYSVILFGCSVFNVHIIGHSDAPDLDLGIFLDGKNGQPVDGITQPEEFVAYCADADADEEVILENPVDGTYLIKVFGYMVSSEPAHFDMTIDIVSDKPGIFSAAVFPGPLNGFTLRNINLTWDIDISESDGKFIGGMYIGTDSDPHIHMIPINLQLDRTPPEILDSSLEGNQPTIWIQFSVDYNAELDQLSPRLLIDGKDFTACAEIYMPKNQYYGWGDIGRWNGYIVYTPEKMINGIHVVNFSVADIAGNVAYHNRTFTVNSPFQPGIFHNPEAMTNVHYITPINAIIESDFEIAEALLHYKAVGQSTFITDRLSKIGTNTYHGQIPAQGTIGTLRYYLTVEDVNGSIATSPSISPETNPYLVAVNEFGHPIISHEPILYCGDSGLEISALISDESEVISVTLYCKNEVHADYTPVVMDNIGGHVYSTTVASGIIDAHNLSYYISATDGENTVTHPCNIDEPHRAEYMLTGVPGGTLRVAMQDDAKSMNPLVVSDEWSWKILERIYDGTMTVKSTTNELIPYIAVGSANESSKTEGWEWDDCTVGNFGYNPKDTWNPMGPNVGEAVIFYDFENVTWHDGHQMDIRDVMFSMHMAAQVPEWSVKMNLFKDLGGRPGSNYSSTSWLHIYKIWESPDQLQAALKFVLQEPFADFFTSTLDVILFPYHIWGSTISGQNVDDAKIWCDPGYDINMADSWKVTAAQSYENIPPVGSGPFDFEIWSKGQYVIINTFREHFFGTDYKYTDHVLDEYGSSLAFQPNIDSVIFKIYKTAEAAVLALKNGDIDYISWPIPPSFAQEIAKEPGIDFIETPESGFSYLAYNMRKTSFGYLNGDPANGDVSKSLRKAIAHCIKKDWIVNQLLQGYGVAGDGPISPSSEWYNTSIPRYFFGSLEAKEILANSGYMVNENGTLLSGQNAIDAAGPGNWWVNPDGSNIGSSAGGKIEILTPEANYDPIRAQAGLMIDQNLRDMGIYAESVAMDFGSIIDRIENRNFDMYILGWTIGSDPTDYLWAFFHSSNAQIGQNYPGYQNSSFDALIDYARATSDVGEKRDSIFQAHASICYDLPYDVLYYRTNIEAYRSDRFTGWMSEGGTIYNDYSLRRIHKPDLELPSPNIVKKEFGGTMRVALESEPGLINPLVSTDEDSLKVMDLVFDSLARVDPITLKTVPWIAESWSVSPDNMTVRVNLRADVRWHDGELLDAHDVKHTFDTYGLDYLSLVFVMDPLTVDFHMTHPDSRFFGEAVLMKLIPQGFTDLDEGNGCGPFVMAGRLPGESLSISANPDYFAGRPNIDGIRFTYYDDFKNASIDLMSGHLDLIGWELTSSQVATNVNLNGTNTNLLMHPDIKTAKYNELSQMYLGFNTQNTPLDQAEVRRAIAHAVDKEMLTMYDISGCHKISDSLTSPFNFPFYNVSVEKYRSDIQQANRILDAAGFFDRNGDGCRNMATSPYDSFQLTMLGPSIEDVNGYTMTTNIITWLHQIGLNVTLISANESLRWQYIKNGDFDIYFDNLRIERDPAFLNDQVGSGSNGNHANYTDATMEFLLSRMNVEMNQTLRARYAQDCFGWLAQELPYLPLMDVRYQSAYNKNGFTGWVSTLGGPVNFWSFLNVHPVFDPAPTSLDAPQALFAIRMNSTSIRLTWAANKEVELMGYTVYRSDTQGGPYTPITSTDTITSYIDEAANPHEDFFYVITADSPESGYSDEAHVRITHVLSTQPVHGDYGILPTLDVVVTFSDSMNTSVTPTLSQVAGTSVTYTFSGWTQTNLANDTATWTHDSWAQNDAVVLNVSGFEDMYGNVGTSHVWSFSTEDTIPPTSSVNDIVPYWRISSPLALTATANDDGAGIAFVEFWYRFRLDNSSAWSPDWTKYDNDTITGDGGSTSFTFPQGEGFYEFYSRAGDVAGNYEGAPTSRDTLCGYDTTAPISSADDITPSTTSSSILPISYTSNDAWSGVKNVTLWYSFSLNGTGYSTWQKFGTESISPGFAEFNFNFPSGNGYYQLYTRATDFAGNWEGAPTGNDTWVYMVVQDTMAPDSSVNAISPYWENTTPITVTATASDADGTVANVTLYYRHSANNATWGNWTNFGLDTTEPWNWTFGFPDGQGYYEFYSIANDTAGNTEVAPATAETDCAYDATSPNITDTSPAAGTTDDGYTFRAVVTDNMNLSAVHVIYWFGSGTETNATMKHTTADNRELAITIPLNSLDTLHYRIAAVDRAGNWNSTLTRNVAITDNDDPVADAGPDQTVNAGALVTFTGAGSTDNIGIANHTWNFTHNGTAITLYGVSPAFRFWAAGNYTVTLTVRDTAGNTDSDTMQVNVAEAAQPADITPPVADAGPDQALNAGALVTFTGASSTDNVGIANYTWTFTHNGTAVTLYGVSPTFRFWTAGNYTVTLTVRDAAGNTDTDSVLITVNPVAGPGDGGGGLGNYLWIIIILIVISVISLLIVLRRKPEAAEPPARQEPVLETEPCPNCGFDIEKGAPCPFCAPDPAPDIPEPEPPKPGLSNEDKLARVEKAYREGQMSEEQYLRNIEKFSKP